MGGDTLDVTPAWAFFSWLFVGLWAAATSAWLIGDLTMLYWVPRLTRAAWMLNPLPMLGVWLLADILTVVAHWLVWLDNGGWRDALGALLFGLFYVLATIAWHGVLYWFHQIRAAFWTSIVAAALAVATTIWFWVLGNTTAGVLMLIVLAWVFYVSLWNFQLARLNTVNGRVRRAGATAEPLVFQRDDAGAPPPSQWDRVGRRCPFERQFTKFTNGTTKFGRGGARMFAGDAAAFGADGAQLAPQQPGGGGGGGGATATIASSTSGAAASGRRAQAAMLLQQQQQQPAPSINGAVQRQQLSSGAVVYDDVVRNVGQELPVYGAVDYGTPYWHQTPGNGGYTT